MIEPLRVEFDVACPADHAFEVWTGRIGRWWPVDHTASGEADTTVVLEGRPGGRIFERTAAGIEHDWGEITTWEPPTRFGYLWHLRRDRADATEVEIRFVDLGDATRIEIEHRGWERLRADGETWRDRNRGGWATLLPHFAAGSRPSGRKDVPPRLMPFSAYECARQAATNSPVIATAFNTSMAEWRGALTQAEAMLLFGRIIRQARYHCQLSQRQLEWVCGVDQTVISRLENGRIRHMRIQQVARVVAGLAGHVTINRGEGFPMPERAARRLPRSPESG